jgi:ABC-2 type transport system ATP-binding protein
MLSVQGLSYAYDAHLVLSNVSFEYDQPKLIGLLGQNGAGKSTLIKLLTGLLTPQSGEIKIDGVVLVQDGQEAMKEKIGYLPEKNPLYQDFEVLEYLSWVNQIKGQSKIDFSLLERLGLQSVLHQKIATLSKGFKQRVGIAQALLHQPKILILDEPTSGLDLIQVQAFKKLLAELKKDQLILMSTHHLDDLKGVADEILWVKDGKVIKQLESKEMMILVHWQVSFKEMEIKIEQIIDSFTMMRLIKKNVMGSTVSLEIEMREVDIPLLNRSLIEKKIDVFSIERQVMILSQN